jgi:hypothetical protein
MPPVIVTIQRRVLTLDDDDDDDDDDVPVPTQLVKRSRPLTLEDDDDGDVTPTVVAKPTKKKARVSKKNNNEAAIPEAPPTCELVRQLSKDMGPVFTITQLLQRKDELQGQQAKKSLPSGTVVPATRPVAPTSLISNKISNVAADLDEVRQYLSEFARKTLAAYRQLHPDYKPRRRDAKTGQLVPYIPDSELKAAERPAPQFHTFQFEQQLLFFADDNERESPLRPGLKFKSRPCVQGEHCIGMATPVLKTRDPPPGAPPFKRAPYMQRYSMKELEVLYTTGEQPAEPRDCIRCLRYVFGSVAIHVAGTHEAWAPSAVLQSFANTIGGETGYLRECCLLPSAGGVFNGLVQPLVHDQDFRLFNQWDPYTKGYFTDQRGMASAETQFSTEYPNDIWKALRKQQQSFQNGAAVVATTSTRGR